MIFWDDHDILNLVMTMNKNTDMAIRILKSMSEKNVSYGELSSMTGIPKSALQRYATGATEKIPLPRVELIAKALNISAAYLMGWEDSSETIPSNILPMPEMKKVPLVGTIACGEPILAEENLDGEVDLPEHIHADFALRCKGDSMINARIYDGDIVYIRQQPTVEDGEIAAVLIGDEATLKRVRFFEDHVVLEPENPLYRPLSYWGEEMSTVRILGKAVAFTSKVR